MSDVEQVSGQTQEETDKELARAIIAAQRELSHRLFMAYLAGLRWDAYLSPYPHPDSPKHPDIRNIHRVVKVKP
jgi:hypothetical protein